MLLLSWAAMAVTLAWASLAMSRFPIRPELLELLAGLLAGAIAIIPYLYRPDKLEHAAALLRRTAVRRALWIPVFALLGPCIRLALLPLAPIPYPTVHDEFVHLLGADTLLHGRLANPPLPFSDSFETLYVIQRPTYSSSYPVGNAAFLAAGWKLTGEPWFGVWFSVVLCCGAVAWMQYRWLAPTAAWIGGLLCTLGLGIASDWMNTYYGGAAAAAGGALVFGALRGLRQTAKPRDAAILAAGWTLVWFNRPYESVAVGIIVAVAVLASLRRDRRLISATLLIGAVVVLDFAGLCYQNWRVTGDPLLDPYRLTQRLYGVPHGFLWQREIPEPAHLTPQQQRIYLYQRNHFREARSLSHCWPLLGNELKKIWFFFVGYPLTIPFGIGLFARGKKAHSMRVILAAAMAWSLLYPRLLPNYVSALTCLFFGLSAYGLLVLWRWRPHGQAWGAVLATGFLLGSAATGARVLYPWFLHGASAPPTARETVERKLEAIPGPQLVFVRYGPTHNVHDEWVYNGADPRSAKMVWANDLGEARDRELMEYFKGRRAWVAEPDRGLLRPYP